MRPAWRTRFPGPLFCVLLVMTTSAVAVDEDDLMQRPPWAACEYCHGSEGRIDSPNVPAIAGQSASYIAKQLADFRAGRRVSPQAQMRSAMMLLDTDDDTTVARYFADIAPLTPPGKVDEAGGPGARLFWSGAPGRAPCAACHAAEKGALIDGYPNLFGLNRDYLTRQLRAFRDGSRDNDPDGVMRSQAATLSDGQIEALGSYLASAIRQ